MKNKFLVAALLAAGLCQVFAGGKQGKETVTLTVAAAASLKNAFENDLIPAWTQSHPGIKITGVYDSSGKLQTQIENGLEADIFFSAATTQMDALVAGGFISKDSVVNLLQNKLVLIKPLNGATTVTGFNNISSAKSIVIGDPKSVPAGQYAQEALTKLGSWADIDKGSSKATNVTEVLQQVASGSAEVGIVYATDAASSKDVVVIQALADGILAKPVMYPVGIAAKTAHGAQAALFAKFLESPAGMAIFTKYGFVNN